MPDVCPECGEHSKSFECDGATVTYHACRGTGRAEGNVSDRATDESPIAQLTRERDSEKARADAAEATIERIKKAFGGDKPMSHDDVVGAVKYEIHWRAHSKARVKELEAKVRSMIGSIRRHIQPSGSPPPGDETTLAEWACLESKANLIVAERLVTAALRSEETVTRLNAELTADRDAWRRRAQAILANLGTIECPACDSDPSCEECGGRGVIPRVGEWSDYAAPMPPPDHIGDANKMVAPEAGKGGERLSQWHREQRDLCFGIGSANAMRLAEFHDAAATLIESQARRIEAVNELAHQLDGANQDRDRLAAALAECRSNLHDAIKTGGKLIEEHRAALAERDREIERVRGALLEIEWQHNPLIEIRKWCPACGNHDLDGHDDDCVIDAALKPTGGAATQ